MASEDEFKVVKGRKGRKRNNAPKRYVSYGSKDIVECLTIGEKDAVKARIEGARQDLIISEFSPHLEEMMKVIQERYSIAKTEFLSASGCCQPKELVCYGIGSFGTCAIARYQLAFLLLLKEKLKIEEKHTLVYDPVLTSDEKEIINQLGVEIITENEEGKRGAKANTLFYMPHCGKALYNNLLWKNWSEEQLKQVVLIGNSFSNMQLSLSEREMSQKYSYILRIIPCTEEFALRNEFKYQDIFNDTSVHYFPENRLRTVTDEFWLNCEEPKYDQNDLEIIKADK